MKSTSVDDLVVSGVEMVLVSLFFGVEVSDLLGSFFLVDYENDNADNY